MAAVIRYDYDQMRKAVSTIGDISGKYQAAAQKLENEFTNAISKWEGETHDAMLQFISGPVMNYCNVNVPKLLTALAELLKANIDQMESADRDIAQSIPKSVEG